MNNQVLQYLDFALEALSDHLGGYYLAEGTALAKYYYNHRESYDLDFFTQSYNKKSIGIIVDFLSKKLDKRINLIAEQTQSEMVMMAVYNLEINNTESLKIDFVEDPLELLNQPKLINGIPVLSLEDIYMRKLLAISGSDSAYDATGRINIAGSRQEAKDFFDVYFLSHTFMPLSQFVSKYCQSTRTEALVRWYRTYDRLKTKTDLLDLVTNQTVSYIEMERHFKQEIDKLIELIL